MKKTSKKLFVMLICFVLVIGAMAVSALAAEEVASGKCGENISWVLTDDGVLTISGEGEMHDYDAISSIAPPAFLPQPVPAPWYEYRTHIKKVVIEDGVTKIGSYAFNEFYELTDVQIPESVTEINGNAFGYCYDLSKIVIPNSVRTMKSSIFLYCDKLTDVTLSNSITEIPSQMFYGCTALESITIPNSVTLIDSGAFWYCSNLKEITIPENVTAIEDSAFAECCSITEVTIPESVSVIGSKVFENCTSLTSVVLPEKLNKISYGLFSGCAELTEASIPETVTEIQGMAFYGCSSLESAVIPGNVTEIGFNAFEGCASLTEVNIPSGVKNIGTSAFANCTDLTKINVNENNSYYCSDASGVVYNKDKTILVQVPNGLTGSYVIPEGVTRIEDGAFVGCGSLESVTIPASLTEFGTMDTTFGSCTSLARITVHEDNAKYMNDESGVLYTKDKTMVIEAPRKISGSYSIPEGVTRINRFAFENCDALTDITIPASVINIDVGPFGGCDALTEIKVHGNNQNYFNDESGALYRKGNISLIQVPGGLSGSYTIQNGTDNISVYAFYDCDKLTEIIIADSVTYISDYAFYGCSGITSIIIPEFVEVMDDYVFENCDALRIVQFMGDYSANTFTFGDIITTCYYPDNSDSWESALKRWTNDNITWIPYTPGEPLPIVKGDVDGDGKIANTDLVIVARYIVGLESGADIEKFGDIDGDGSVTNTDLVALARIVVGF